jgi:hypothetical protein
LYSFFGLRSRYVDINKRRGQNLRSIARGNNSLSDFEILIRRRRLFGFIGRRICDGKRFTVLNVDTDRD